MNPSGPGRCSPPQTPEASSVGASSPAKPTNLGSTDLLGNAQDCIEGSLQNPCVSLSTNHDGSSLESRKPSCRPWDRVDLLRRLATFTPSNWFGKPEWANALTCARRGWLNADTNKIGCEICGAFFYVNASPPLASSKVDAVGKAFEQQLDACHHVTCPWKGCFCADGLIQFPLTSPAALIGGFKDRLDGLLQFPYLPKIASSTIEEMKLSRSMHIDRLPWQLNPFPLGESSFKMNNIIETESPKEDALYNYCCAQKLIGLCGWEPRWLLNMQDCEEHSTQSARNACSISPTEVDSHCCQNTLGSKSLHSASRLKSTSRLSLLDCSLCGATVRIRDFISVARPPYFGWNDFQTPDPCNKVITRGVSAASGINEWAATDGIKNQKEGLDDASTDNKEEPFPNAVVGLHVTEVGRLPLAQSSMPLPTEQFGDDISIGDLTARRPSESEIGGGALSYKSQGANSRKPNFEGDGSTIDRPLDMFPQADSVEGIVVDHGCDETDDGIQYMGCPSKRVRSLDVYDTSNSSYRFISSGATPSHLVATDSGIYVNRVYSSKEGSNQVAIFPSVRDSTRASSVIAMDTLGHSVDDSMDSVENYPRDAEDVHLPSQTVSKNSGVNEALENNYSNQAQQSMCQELASQVVVREIGGSCKNKREEILNVNVVSSCTRDAPNFRLSGGSLGVGASHEAEIHDNDVSIHRTESKVADTEAIAEVTENVGQTADSVPCPGLMGESVPEEIFREGSHGFNQEIVSRLVGKEDSGSKVCGSPEVESIDSGQMHSYRLIHDCDAHPSLSCNAAICSEYEASKEEVSQIAKTTDDCTVLESENVPGRQIGQEDAENKYVLKVQEFDPVRSHNSYCPWVNRHVAAAGCTSSSPSSTNVALCGWELTLDALDNFQSLGYIPNQVMQSESAASLYKDDHFSASRKLLKGHSMSESYGKL